MSGVRVPDSPPNFGGIAQLVERLHGMQEVSGSIPLTSTIFPDRSRSPELPEIFDREEGRQQSMRSSEGFEKNFLKDLKVKIFSI